LNIPVFRNRTTYSTETFQVDIPDELIKEFLDLKYVIMTQKNPPEQRKENIRSFNSLQQRLDNFLLGHTGEKSEHSTQFIDLSVRDEEFTAHFNLLNICNE
jgi:hypothetical protein